VAVDDNSGAGAAAAVEEVAAGADDEVDEEGRTVPAELSHWIKESSSLSNHATGRAWFSVHSDERQSELKLKTVPAGCRGLKYSCPATLADAADGIVHAWCQNVSQETIINCWLKAKILTPQAMLQLAGMSKKLQRHIAAAAKVDDFKELEDILANLGVEVVHQELESSVA